MKLSKEIGSQSKTNSLRARKYSETNAYLAVPIAMTVKKESIKSKHMNTSLEQYPSNR
jgi:hypothetical protein